MKDQLQKYLTDWVWPAALGGLAAVMLAALLGLAESALPTAYSTPIRLILTFGGALAVAIAIRQQPREVRLLILASITCVAGYFGIPAEWDSMRMVATFGAIVSAVGAVLVALPSKYRKIAVSGLVVFHFGGILCSMTGPPPQPWLSNVIGVGFYRPYIQFMYLTNAYQFYSPEPGPASQLWLCVQYMPDAEGNSKVRWLKLPRRPEDMLDPLALSYYRRLALTQNLENSVPGAGPTDEMIRARLLMARNQETGIPIDPEITPIAAQYRLPPDAVRDHLLPSYIRHVAQMPQMQHNDGKTPIDSIKVYLVVHRLLTPGQINRYGMQPYDDAWYRPYYFGEFDTEGRLKSPTDPLIYWVVPIFWQPKGPDVSPDHTPRTHPNDFKLIDGVKRHTGSDHNFRG